MTRTESIIRRTVNERASQICEGRARAVGVEEFKRSMSPLIIAEISELAGKEMDEYLLMAVIEFRRVHKIESCLICGAKPGQPCDAGLHG